MSRHLYASPHPELALFAITCKSNELAKHYEEEKETEIAGLIFNATRQLLMAYSLALPAPALKQIKREQEADNG